MAYVLWNVVAQVVDDFHLEIHINLSHCEESRKLIYQQTINLLLAIVDILLVLNVIELAICKLDYRVCKSSMASCNLGILIVYALIENLGFVTVVCN
jgi:hypothetical protein